MLHHCPACQRSFDEPGFCPFDRTQLAPGPSIAQKPTVVTDPAAALQPAIEPALEPAVEPASEPPGEPAIELTPGRATQVDTRRETFPLTPSAPVLPSTPPATASRPKVRAVSATGDIQEALGAIRNTQPESEYDLLVGQTLDGKYYVEKKIGEGGMGVVFAARHAVIERPLAIKVLKREVMRDTATIRRFVQEAKAASRIGHPNIVDVIDFGTTPDGMTYSVMEFVIGQTLGAAMRAAGPFPPLRAIRIAAQMARALGAAHDKGVVHRDLKPENVFLVDRDGRPDFVKIVDFGIAKVSPVPGSSDPDAPRLTRAGSVFGTPEYMAPEQAAGKSDTDARVDIYALGVILYEMICGRVPHRGDSTVRTLAMQMLDPIEPPSKVRPDLGIHPELESVIMTALAKKREQRYQTMGQFLDALDRVLTRVGQSVTGSPVYALSPLPPGADPNVVPASPTTPTVRPASSPTSQPPRSKSPTTRRPKDEPEFVAQAERKPLTFEHVWTESDLTPPRSRWPMLVLLALLLGGGALAAVLVLSSRSSTSDTPNDTHLTQAPADAGVATADATLVAEAVDAAMPVPPRDARDAVVVLRPDDDGPRIPAHRRDAGPKPVRPLDTPNGRGTIMVQVLTKPEGAALYVGYSYRGPGGATLEEPFGSQLEVRCRMKGYKEGKVQITFDGNTEAVLCVLERIKVCIDGIKNPFDDCEVAEPPADPPVTTP